MRNWHWVVFLSYVHKTYHHISRLLTMHNTKSVGLPPRKISCFLWPVENDLVLRHQVHTPSSASVARSTLDRLAVQGDQDKTPPPAQPAWTTRQCTIAEHRFNHDHHIQLQDTKILSTKPNYMDGIIRDTSELKLHCKHGTAQMVVS
jgi:hypothetical protein